MTADMPSGPLLAVEEALARILAGVEPLAPQDVTLRQARGRVLAGDVQAKLTQPPFDASAMDGYAVMASDVTATPVTLKVIGASAAGHPFPGSLGAGETVRIFTGAVLPAGADAIVIQEDADRAGERVSIRAGAKAGTFVRPRGGDFRAGQTLLEAGRRLTARDISLAAAMGHDRLSARRRPVVAMLATGDELVAPGTTPANGQIVSSIPDGLSGLIEAAGGDPFYLGIAADSMASLDRHLAQGEHADILVTIGGASVGEHDLVQRALAARGLDLAFWKIAMRPGKPLMFGRLGAQRVLGLPGNPVSAFLCAEIFLRPLISALLGHPAGARPMRRMRLAGAIEATGPRAHYMRAEQVGSGGEVRALASQDSSLLATLARADCLIVRPPGSPALEAGAEVEVLALED